MAKKKVSKKKMQVRGAWFRKRESSPKDKWGFVPINWKGTVALILLLAVNIFSASYFSASGLTLDDSLKIAVVFLLSVFVFIEFAKKKTRK